LLLISPLFFPSLLLSSLFLSILLPLPVIQFIFLNFLFSPPSLNMSV
jgi:hypothetical protein